MEGIIHKEAHWGWNWDYSGDKPREDRISINDRMDLVCKECFAKAKLAMHLELRITDYQAQYVTFYVEGSAEFNIHAIMSPAWERKGEKHLRTVTAGPIKFAIGRSNSTHHGCIVVHASQASLGKFSLVSAADNGTVPRAETVTALSPQVPSRWSSTSPSRYTSDTRCRSR